MTDSQPNYDAAPEVVMKMSDCMHGQSMSTVGFCLATLVGLWMSNYPQEKREQAWSAFTARAAEAMQSCDEPEPTDTLQ
jgi:hypothetical protein